MARGAQHAPRPFFTEFKVLPLSARLKSPPLTSRRLLPVVVGCVVVSEALTAEAAASRAPQPTPEVASCLRAAAHKFRLDARLLKAIARVESGFNPRAVNAANANGTRDIGLMQINSTWLPTLRRWGITEKDLFNPCTNAEVGAWVLASNFSNMGPSWDAVGAYNARSPHKRQAYAWKVYRAYQQHKGQGTLVAAHLQDGTEHQATAASKDVQRELTQVAQSSLIEVSNPVAAVTGERP